MLSTVRIATPAAFLESGPDINRLLAEHRPRLSSDDLRRQLFDSPPGERSERDHPDHLLVISAGRAIGLVPRWRRHRDRRQFVLGLGAEGGPLVIGRNRTLTLLGLMRMLVASADQWDAVLACGSGVAGDLRRLETAARCERASVRMFEVRSASVLGVLSPASWRGWWNTRVAGEDSLAERWDLAAVAGVSERPRRAIPREVVPVLRVVAGPEEAADTPPGSTRRRRRPPTTKPRLRVVYPG